MLLHRKGITVFTWHIKQVSAISQLIMTKVKAIVVNVFHTTDPLMGFFHLYETNYIVQTIYSKYCTGKLIHICDSVISTYSIDVFVELGIFGMYTM